jgi:hypothetical protein
MTELNLQEAYDVRPIRFLELWHESGWALKEYGIAYRRDLPREELVGADKDIARKRLTNSTNSDHRIGFLGVHDGLGANFVYLDYWTDENELHHHVYVSPSEDSASLEYATPTGLIACTWDLRSSLSREELTHLHRSMSRIRRPLG